MKLKQSKGLLRTIFASQAAREPVEAVYIHIPFCLKKCNYCDFLSFARPAEMERYVQLLLQEMRAARQCYRIEPKSIFIGGGTPTCLPEELLEQVLRGVQDHLMTSELVEYTVEANPGTLTEKKLRLMKHCGVNRLSLGIQSDNEEQLRLLGRVHSFAQAQEAVRMAKAAGFDNINGDFMYGLPGQTLAQWRHTLEQALALETQHLSLYQLKMEDGTPMAQWLQAGEIEEFDDELALAMYRLSQELLEAQGYQQYEISNFARLGYCSRHNQVYWRTENYLGLGLGACSWIRPMRWNNCFTLEQYAAQVVESNLPETQIEVVTEAEQMEETVFMALRMQSGLSKKLFAARFGKKVGDVFADALQRCRQKGWLVESEEAYMLTEEGRVLGNLVFMEFIS